MPLVSTVDLISDTQDYRAPNYAAAPPRLATSQLQVLPLKESQHAPNEVLYLRIMDSDSGRQSCIAQGEGEWDIGGASGLHAQWGRGHSQPMHANGAASANRILNTPRMGREEVAGAFLGRPAAYCVRNRVPTTRGHDGAFAADAWERGNKCEQNFKHS